VCFADVRGFTDYCQHLQREMQDAKIQNFLRAYAKIFAEALMYWFQESFETSVKQDPAIQTIAQYVVPSTYKNLGDGMMLVWEIPSELLPPLQGQLTHQILDYIDTIRRRFNFRFKQLNPTELDAYSAEVEQLEMGFGVTRGHAWRLDYEHSVDYAGSIINLASRLESHARPCGMISTYDVSPWVFTEMTKDRVGHIGTLEGLKGYTPVHVFLSPEVDPSKVQGFKKETSTAHLNNPASKVAAHGSPTIPPPTGNPTQNKIPPPDSHLRGGS